MHQLALARLSAFLAVLALVAAVVPARAQTAPSSTASGAVSVLYAGSLVTPMEGPVKAALRARGIAFEGEPGGSRMLAHLISSGLRSPDAFISVDPALVRQLGKRVETSTTFAGTSIGIAWSNGSRYAALFAKVASGQTPLLAALATPGLKIGRTDPQLDPKGAYTIEAMKLLAGPVMEHRILGDDENDAQIFPEESLLARLETGEADVAFLYRTEAIARGDRFLALPGRAALTDRITYTLAIMRNAPHPAAAHAFAAFILTGPGRALLERAGLTYFKRPAGSR